MKSGELYLLDEENPEEKEKMILLADFGKDRIWEVVPFEKHLIVVTDGSIHKVYL